MVFGPSALPAALAPGASEADKVTAAKKQIPGIPFYNHYGVCTKETVWLEPQTTLALTVTADGGKPVTQTITLNNHAFHDTTPTEGHNANSLVMALNEAQGKHELENTGKFCPASVARSWGAVRDAYKVERIEDASPEAIKAAENGAILVRVSNTADIGTAVDYSRVYYLNAKSPLIGTGSVDATLNKDGTLGEGKASVDDETGTAVLGAVGTVGSGGLTAWSTVAAARISGAATVQAAGVVPAVAEARDEQRRPSPCAAGEGWPEVKNNVTYEFTVTPAGFKHDYKSVVPLEQLGGMCVPSDIIAGGNYTVTPLGEESKPEKKDTNKDPNAKDGATPPKP
jgi:hypothetical protein